MTHAMRWRIMTLQAILTLVFGFSAGFLFYESSFVNGMVHDQLAAQKIYFPDQSQIKEGGALDPAEFPASIRQYAGQPLDSGDKAKEYADHFIGKHLQSVAKDPTTGQVLHDDNGQPMTYATMGDYINKQKAAGASSVTITALTNERNTMFTGEMLRGTLLNAWGWSQVALYTGYAAWAMALAALVTLGTLVFEALFARKLEQ